MYCIVLRLSGSLGHTMHSKECAVCGLAQLQDGIKGEFIVLKADPVEREQNSPDQ